MRKFLARVSVIIGASLSIPCMAHDCQALLYPALNEFTALEEQAIAMLEAAVVREQTAKEEVRWWIGRLRMRQLTAQPISILEHVALAYISRSEFFLTFGDATVAPEIRHVLNESWLHLTGIVPEPIDGRLPKSLLRTASREARLLHAASFQPDITSGTLAARESFAEAEDITLASDYIPEAKDGALALALLGASFQSTGSEVLAASFFGYTAATLAEYAMHKHLGHPSKKLRTVFKRAGWIGRYALATAFGHATIHHGRTYRKAYNTQFESEAEKRTLDEQLESMGDDGKEVIKSRYGVTLSHSGVRAGLIAGLAVTAPVYAALVSVLGLDPITSLTAFLPTSLYIAASKYLHPYLHMNRDEAMARTSPFGRWFLSTRYAEMMSRLHYVHHTGIGREGNYNLVFGADAALGELHKPNLREVFAMRKLGLIGAYWGNSQTNSEP